jgi:hypothetical protein
MSPRAPSFDDLPLFPSEEQLALAILGKRARDWRQIAAHYDGKGLPAVDPVMGARYAPAVKAFFDKVWNVNATHIGQDGPERSETWAKRRNCKS